jgi:hypothetical protein
LRRIAAREGAAIPEFLSFSGWFSLSSAGVVDRLAQAQGTLVKDDQSSPAGGVNRFQTTRWSVVLVSAQSQAPGYKQALADLCKLYWYPLYAFVRHRGYSPEKIFDARWAVALLGEAMNRLSREYIAQGKEGTFRALKAFLDPINTKRLPSYEEIAAELEVSIGSLKKQIHRLRKQYTATVREEISRTVSDSADVDTETHELCEALIAAEEGWVIP